MGDHICLECAFGYYPAGATCAPVDFSAPECTRTIAGDLSAEFHGYMENNALPEDPAGASKVMDKWIQKCEAAGCVPDAMVLPGVMTVMNDCYPPSKRRASEYGFIKQL